MSDTATRDRPVDFEDNEESVRHRSQKRAKLDTTNAGGDLGKAPTKSEDMVVDVEEGQAASNNAIPDEGEQNIIGGQIAEVDAAESGDRAENFLPPSHVLLGKQPAKESVDVNFPRVTELDVGISEYVSHDVPPMHGVIKQRYDLHIVLRVLSY